MLKYYNYEFLNQKILVLDQEIVVVQCQMAFYNILLFHSEIINFEEDIWKNMIIALEKQLDLLVNL